MEALEQKFQILLSRLNERPLVKIRYFIPDLYKDGGSYKEEEVIVRRIDMNRRILISEDKKSYDLAYIINVSSDLFDDYEDESTEEHPQSAFTLFRDLQGELERNGFLSAMMTAATEAEEVKTTADQTKAEMENTPARVVAMTPIESES